MERRAYLNGEFVKEDDAKVSILDRGFTSGDGVYDIFRTYNHRPFRLADYLERFFRSMKYVEINPPMPKQELEGVVIKLLSMNLPLIGENDEYSVVMRVTRGSELSELLNPGPPTVIVHCRPVALESNARIYREGINLRVATTRRIPSQCISPAVKTQNRMNHTLAELGVRGADPDAYCVMLDVDGNVAEGFATNIFIFRDGCLRTPVGNCLEGVTRKTILELAEKMGVRGEESNFEVYSLYSAEEVFLCGTSPIILPVRTVDGRAVGGQVPGPVTRSLLKAWGEMVGVDLIAQAKAHGARRK